MFANRKTTLALLAIAGCAVNGWAETGCDERQPQTTANNVFDQTVPSGTIVDTRTGLQWMRCQLNYQWQESDATCIATSAAPEGYSWTEALAAAEEFSYAGHTDWRIPNKKELSSIVEYQCHQPAINQVIFPATEAEAFWTSTPVPYASPVAVWSIRFADGGFTFQNATIATNQVRLVRNAEQ